jgi:aspartyl-tRNA(Asn)/glutamyl-tRNA(Gln) amidotransferase subunit C
MSFDEKELAALGRLARLSTTPALAGELQRVLQLLDALERAPVDGLAPLAHPHDAGLVLREDVVTATNRSEELLALAPDTNGSFYLVPRVIE